jgi:prolyl oligopeptidase
MSTHASERHSHLYLIVAFAMAFLVATGAALAGPGTAIDTGWIEYPAAERTDQVDTFHGVEVADPYRWLEDEDSEATREWVAAQDAIAERFFDSLPERSQSFAYLDKNWIDGVAGVPVRKGGNTFFWEPARGQNHPILYVRKGDAEPEVVFDLNQNDPDGLKSTRMEMTVSPNGRYVSYAINHAGADAAETHFFDTVAGKELDEFIPASYSGVTSWMPDESGFYYMRLDLATLMGMDPEIGPGVYYHALGRPMEEDALVYARPWEGMYVAAAEIADDEEHLLITDMNIMGSRGSWGSRPLEGGPDTEITWLTDPEPNHRFALIDSKGSEVFFVTDYNALNWRIVAADMNNPGMENLREVVPESDEPISMYGGTNIGLIVLHEDLLYVTYIQHNAHVIRVFDLGGNQRQEIALPFLGSVTGIQTAEDDPILYIGLQSFLTPHSIYAYDTGAGTLKPLKTVEVPAEFADYEMERVFYESKDGTRCPMTILKRKDTPLDGTSKVQLYGYGGWNIPLMPGFNNWIHAWLNMGGIYAVANLRGGGEYGDSWHQAGMFFNKQNVFDDFMAAADYLASEGYTSHSRITIRGGSNGGLLTAACYNQHPEKFGAVISQVAAVDLLRMPYTPIGATMTNELGAPDQSAEMFEYLLGYSPLHNVRHEGPYPPILHMVGENDPRCKPGHIFKYVAEMQRTPADERLAILRIIKGAGHGTSRKEDLIGWTADELAFAWAMTE